MCYPIYRAKVWRIGNPADVKMLEETYRKLKEILKKTDITLKWVEKETGISVRTIQRWMEGKHQPHPVLYLQLKKVVDRLYDLTYGKVTVE